MLGYVARSLRLTRVERMTLIDFPAALPQIMAGIRISIATAILLSVAAEMLLASNGIGTFIVRAQERFQIAKNLAALLAVVILSFSCVNALLQLADRKSLAWHHGRTTTRRRRTEVLSVMSLSDVILAVRKTTRTDQRRRANRPGSCAHLRSARRHQANRTVDRWR